MSVTDLPTPTRPETLEPAAPSRARAGSTPWVRLGLACAILVGSGVARSWQQRRIAHALEAGRQSRLDLASIPSTLGDWRGEPFSLDPKIVRATGADQAVTRRYVHQGTGVTLDVILLFGPAVDMYLHSPELCYPVAGFTLVDGPVTRPIPTGRGGASAPFRAMVYAKGEGAQAEHQEVYYTWRFNGRWTPEVGKQKHFERIAGMYKIHVARRVSAGERRDVDNPSEAFLGALLPELESRLSAPPPPRS
jgi:EpsI family protein